MLDRIIKVDIKMGIDNTDIASNKKTRVKTFNTPFKSLYLIDLSPLPIKKHIY